MMTYMRCIGSKRDTRLFAIRDEMPLAITMDGSYVPRLLVGVVAPTDIHAIPTPASLQLPDQLQHVAVLITTTVHRRKNLVRLEDI